ncbi:hypothetical protein CPC08DRAFT_711556 [Agrocybe pediades]|nr:hypothetical protein CPC08DRAFT_711556 [Agrocybe pediades]
MALRFKNTGPTSFESCPNPIVLSVSLSCCRDSEAISHHSVSHSSHILCCRTSEDVPTSSGLQCVAMDLVLRVPTALNVLVGY